MNYNGGLLTLIPQLIKRKEVLPISVCIYDYKVVNDEINFIRCTFNDEILVNLDSVDKASIDKVVVNIDLHFKTDETDDNELHNKINANYLNYHLHRSIIEVYDDASHRNQIKDIPCTINAKVRHLNSKDKNIWTKGELDNISSHIFSMSIYKLHEILSNIHLSDITEINFDCEYFPIYIVNTSNYLHWHVEEYNVRNNYKLRNCTALVIVSPMQIIPTDIKGHDIKYDDYKTEQCLKYNNLLSYNLNYIHPSDVTIEAENSTVVLHRYDRVLIYNNFSGSFDLTEQNQLDMKGLYAKLRDEINFSNEDSKNPNSKESYLKAEFTAEEDLIFHIDFSDKQMNEIFKELVWVMERLSYSLNTSPQDFKIWKSDYLNGLYYFNQTDPQNPYALPSCSQVTTTNIAHMRRGDIIRRMLLTRILIYMDRDDIRDILCSKIHLTRTPTGTTNLANTTNPKGSEKACDYRFKSEDDLVRFGIFHCYNGVLSEDYFSVLKSLDAMYRQDVAVKTYIIFDNCKIGNRATFEDIFNVETPLTEVHLRNNTHILNQFPSYLRPDCKLLTQRDIDTLKEKNTNFSTRLLKRVYCDTSSSITLTDSRDGYLFNISGGEPQDDFYICINGSWTSEGNSLEDTHGRELLHWLPIKPFICERIEETYNSILQNPTSIETALAEDVGPISVSTNRDEIKGF